ncbi:hypothetical protein V1264_015499 [Littorina saxatilis]|uniref:Uncharacterized protein n=1 Tax=Littorina saxatilis TaxID=31220 RepID=A0AAN9BQ62_9CAEN
MLPPLSCLPALFKQLLSIGVMSNAFRGVTVETATGEKHGATEQETEAALQTMVTDMVEDDEDEEEDDEEEMELVMGSLLHNVGSRIEVHEDEPGVKTPPKPKPPAKPPTLITPGRHVAKPSISKTGPASKPALKPPSTQDAGWKTGGTSEMEDILAATALPAKEEAPTKEEDPEKAFLKEVLTGSLYGNKGKAPTLAPPKPEQPKKKKVFKIPPIRLRRSIPMGNPDLLAIRTPCVDLIHEQVKNMLEAQLGTIVSLQHEPEYLQTGDVPLPIRAMWIFKMEDVSVNNHTRICCTGIIGKIEVNIEGDLMDGNVGKMLTVAESYIEEMRSEAARVNSWGTALGQRDLARLSAIIP